MTRNAETARKQTAAADGRKRPSTVESSSRTRPGLDFDVRAAS
jgi:hypothetical protein